MCECEPSKDIVCAYHDLRSRLVRLDENHAEWLTQHLARGLEPVPPVIERWVCQNTLQASLDSRPHHGRVTPKKSV